MTTRTDCRGLEITVENDEAVAGFDRTVGAYLGLRMDTGDHLKATLEADPSFVLANVLRGYFMLLFASRKLLGRAHSSLDAAREAAEKGGCNRREELHIEALGAWASGDQAHALAVWDAILEHGAAAGWASIELIGVRDDSPSTQILESRAAEHGWQADRSVWDVSPYVELPESWDEHVQSLSKKDRHELRRKLRRLEASGDAEYRVYDKEHDELPDALGAFVALMGKSNEAKSDFLTPERRSFLETLTRTMADADSLQLAFLDVGGKPVSATMSFLEGDRLLLYNSGYDPEYRHLSVGLLLKAYELRGAIEQGLREYDFLRGNEPYKYDLGGNDRVLYRWQLARENEAP